MTFNKQRNALCTFYLILLLVGTTLLSVTWYITGQQDVINSLKTDLVAANTKQEELSVTIEKKDVELKNLLHKLETTEQALSDTTEQLKLKEAEIASMIESQKLRYITIDRNYDIMTPTNITTEQMEHALSIPAYSGIKHLAGSFVKAEQEYGISSLYLAATIGWESGWGKFKSNSNNLAGWKNTGGNGFRAFASEDECIQTVGMNIATSWIKNGSSLDTIAARYCPTPGYVDNIINIMTEIHNKII